MLKKSILNYQKFPSFYIPKIGRGYVFILKNVTPSENNKVQQILHSVVATSSRKFCNTKPDAVD